jgi:hypothetical protein
MYVLKNHVSILAESLIISFHCKISVIVTQYNQSYYDLSKNSAKRLLKKAADNVEHYQMSALHTV